MPKMLTAKDTNYVKGMNSLDDPKILSDGEAVEIVNAIPGIPLKMRDGCEGKVLYYWRDTYYEKISGYVVSEPFYMSIHDKEYVFFWTKDTVGGTNVTRRLWYIDLSDLLQNTPPAIQLLSVWGASFVPQEVEFNFVRIGDIIYTRRKYGNNNMFAIEFKSNNLTFAAREVPAADFTEHPVLGQNSFDISANGIFTGSIAFGYSLTLVRRIDTASPNPITTYAPGLIESPEAPSSRYGVIMSNTSGFGLGINIIPVTTGVEEDNVYGFTHVRVYRTENLYASLPNPGGGMADPENQAHLAGATRYFVMDVPLSYFVNNGSVPTVAVPDTVPPAALDGEMNQLQSFNYTFPPPDGYRMLYFKNRLFLMGEKGAVYFSEIPGGDGGGDAEFAQVDKAKYSLWFKPLHWRLELDVEESTASTGIDYYGDDLYLFKENKVYMIIGSDPLGSPLRTVNDKTGCPFPDTITRAIIGGREVLFYLGNVGPTLISEGGNSRPFTEFKVKELWPESKSRIWGGGANGQYCSAAFWNNVLWVFYIGINLRLPDETENKMFGYISTDEVAGAFEIRIADLESKYTTGNLAITNDNRAIAISEAGSNIVSVDFLGNAESCDTLKVSGSDVPHSARPNFRLLSRKLYPGPLERSISELFRATSYCDFSEDRLDDRPFSLEITSNRLRTVWDYYADRTVFQSNQFGKPVAGSSYKDSFKREDGRTWTAGALVGYAAYLYHEDYPDNGVWANVRGNTAVNLEFDTGVGMNFTHVRLIAKSTVRLNIDFAPQADFAGEFFQYRITKVIPKDRNFNWYGLELQTIPRPQLDVESLVGGEPNRNAWE